MSKIRIKNFGPIKEGYLENDGWLDIAKVTVFIGNQGSGKSTVAKAISVMTWLEKALVRGDFEAPQSLEGIKRHFDYQNLKHYFKKDTSIQYKGEAYEIDYMDLGAKPSGFYIRKCEQSDEYFLPKVMYVPAERNFLSVVKNAFDVKGLPETLFTFGEELRRTQQELENQIIDLPINHFQYQHDIENDTSYIMGEGYKLNLNEASSGLQSTIPLYLVSKNLAEKLNSVSLLSDVDPLYDLMSINQRRRLERESEVIYANSLLSAEEKLFQLKKIFDKYFSLVFINIVEEPEQNLYPSSQKKILESLLEFNNMSDGNKLIMTTHSPYLINYLTLAVKSETLKEKVGQNEQLLEKIDQIVPLPSTIKGDDLVIYEFDEKSGTIKKLETYKGLPSDDNELNEMLDEGNDLFAELLEIEQSL